LRKLGLIDAGAVPERVIARRDPTSEREHADRGRIRAVIAAAVPGGATDHD